MLKSIFVQNYALIEKLELDFSSSFSVFTGETGSGKSILLGALGLILGNRADISAIGHKQEKCIVECVFNVQNINLNTFFDQIGIGNEKELVIRRILLPNGKTRAFLNDMPVNLDILKKIGEKLVDIHSQHQNLYLKKQDFQLKVLDAFTGNKDLLSEYQQNFEVYRVEKASLEELIKKSIQEKSNLEFYTYQLAKFEQIDIEGESIKNLEAEMEYLSHGEDIQKKLYVVGQLLNVGESSVLHRMNIVLGELKYLKKIFSPTEKLFDRLESTLTELEDFSQEVEKLSLHAEFDDERLVQVQKEMTVLYQLFEVFRVTKMEDLLNKKIELEQKIDSIRNFDEACDTLSKKTEEQRSVLENLAQEISKRRKDACHLLEAKVIECLRELGMEHAVFQVLHTEKSSLSFTGIDEIIFVFSANKNREPQEIAKIASGGEISRIMLTLKFLISDKEMFPTIIFDEIDTGVSGRIAEKMGQLMGKMGENGQVFTITHLPQIAAMGDVHFQVEKNHEGTQTITSIDQLTKDQRVLEIAKMLSGEEVSESAQVHAREMMG